MKKEGSKLKESMFKKQKLYLKVYKLIRMNMERYHIYIIYIVSYIYSIYTLEQCL